MTSPNILKQPIQDPIIQATQRTAAREAMRISNVEYVGLTINGQPDPPVDAAIRMAYLGILSLEGLKLLDDAGITIKQPIV